MAPRIKEARIREGWTRVTLHVQEVANCTGHLAHRGGVCQLALDDFSREEDSVSHPVEVPAVGNARQLVLAPVLEHEPGPGY